MDRWVWLERSFSLLSKTELGFRLASPVTDDCPFFVNFTQKTGVVIAQSAENIGKINLIHRHIEIAKN